MTTGQCFNNLALDILPVSEWVVPVLESICCAILPLSELDFPN